MSWLAALALLAGASSGSPELAEPGLPTALARSARLEREDALQFLDSFRRHLHADAARALDFARDARAEDPGGELALVALAAEAEALAWVEGPRFAWPLLEEPLERERGKHSLAAVTLEHAAAQVRALESELGQSLDLLEGLEARVERLGSPLLRFARLVLEYEMRFEGSVPSEPGALIAGMRELLAAHPEIADFGGWPDYFDHWEAFAEDRLPEGRKAYAPLLAEARANGDTRLESLLLYDSALISWLEGDFEQVRTRIQACIELCGASSFRPTQAFALEHQMALLVETGQGDAAWAVYQQLLELIEGRGLENIEIFGLDSAQAAAALRGDAEALLALFSQQRDSQPDPQTELRNVRGRLIRSELDDEAARERLAAQIRWGLAGALAVTSLLLGFVVVGRVRLRRANEQLRREVAATRRAEASQLASERKLAHIERMRGLGVIAGGVSHDFNNLLTGVLGNVELLLDSGELSQDSSYRARAIRKAGERGADLCRRLLVYAGQTPSFNDRVELNELINSLLPVLRAATGSDVRLSFEPTPIEAWVGANSTRIDQLLLNLVTNAREAQAYSIEIKLEEQLAPRPVATEGELVPQVVLSVQDDGRGMDEYVREHLFDPFFTTRIEGRGLGLSEVYGVVDELAGSIDVTSEPGRGSTFRVCLPRLAGAFDDHGEVHSPDAQWAPPRSGVEQAEGAALSGTVLVVDDEAHVRELTCAYLRSFGMEAVSAASGEEALDRIELMDPRPSCLLIDVAMPGLTGSELLERIRRKDRDMPVVLMSGNYQANVLARIAGANTPVLSKPFRSQELQAAVAVCLRSAN